MQGFSRNLVRENHLTVHDLIWPVFVTEGENQRLAVPSMPEVERLSIDLLVGAAKEAHTLGIPAIALFPQIEPELKNSEATLAYDDNNLVVRAIKAVKEAVPDLGIICDVALDPFIDHGHDGLIISGQVDNDASIEILVKQALNQAAAGCDVIAPSDMMDGRVEVIRDALDAAGFVQVQSWRMLPNTLQVFMGPFRDAVVLQRF